MTDLQHSVDWLLAKFYSLFKECFKMASSTRKKKKSISHLITIGCWPTLNHGVGMLGVKDQSKGHLTL